VLTVLLVQAARLVQRGQMFQVGLAQHFDELVQAVVLFTFGDVCAAELEECVHILAVDLVCGGEALARGGYVACVEKSAAGLEISRDRVDRRSGLGEDLGRFR
jgi:hypothetical protein